MPFVPGDRHAGVKTQERRLLGEPQGRVRLAKHLKTEVDEESIEPERSAVSLPFETDEHKRIAVRVVDDRGIENLSVIEVE